MSGELPEGWVTTQLRHIAAINPRHPKDLRDGMLATFVPMAGLSENSPQFSFTEERILGAIRKGFTHFAEGDVLFAKITPCMENGKGAVARGLRNGIGCGTTELHVVRPLDGIISEYIYWFLAQEKVRTSAKEDFTGSAGQARVPTRYIEELDIPLAPLPEQRRIVEKLDLLLDKVDACEERLEKIPKILKRFRQSVLAAACSGRLTEDWRENNSAAGNAFELVAEIGRQRQTRVEILKSQRNRSEHFRLRDFDNLFPSLRNDLDLPHLPNSWTWVDLRFMMNPEEPFCYGVVQPGKNDPTGPRMIRVCDMANGNVVQKGLRGIPSSIHSQYTRSVLRGGELLVSVVGTIGRTAIASSELIGANIARAVAKVPIREFRSEYVLLWLSSSKASQWMVGDAREVARKTLNLEQLRTLPVPLAPIAEQAEIVRRVEAFFAFADNIESRYYKAKTHVDKLTPSLLAKAFRGELVPQDPNDEPAEKLLERIRKTPK